MLPHQKGKELETALAYVEKLILSLSPSFQQSKITFTRNKIVTIEDVRYEIDLYVKIDPGSEYSSLFLFECKNWKKPVGPKEIFNFLNKLDKLNAQKGFFIAKNFTKSAIAVEKQSNKIKLIEFSNDVDISKIPEIPFIFISKKKNINGHFDFGIQKSKQLKLNPDKTIAITGGKCYKVRKLLSDLSKQVIDDTLKSEEKTLKEGVNNIHGIKTFTFHDLYIIHKKVQKVKVGVDFSVFKKEFIY